MASIPSSPIHHLPAQHFSDSLKVLTVGNHANHENMPYDIQTMVEPSAIIDLDTWTVFADAVPDVETTLHWVWGEQFPAIMPMDDFTDHHSGVWKSCHRLFSDWNERVLDDCNILFLPFPTENQTELKDLSSHLEVTTYNCDQVWDGYGEGDCGGELLSFPDGTNLCAAISVESTVDMPTRCTYCNLSNVPGSETMFSLLPAELVPVPAEYVTIPADTSDYSLPFDDAVVPVIEWSQQNDISYSSDEEQMVPDWNWVPLHIESSQLSSTCSDEVLVLQSDIELACDSSLSLVPVPDIDLVPVLEQELMVPDFDQVLHASLPDTDLSTQEMGLEEVSFMETHRDSALVQGELIPIPVLVPSGHWTQTASLNAEIDRPMNSCFTDDHTVPVWAIEE